MEYWTCILWLCWTHLLVLELFFLLRIFYVQDHIPYKWKHFTFSFWSGCLQYISFKKKFFPPTKIFSTVSDRNWQHGYSWFVTETSGKVIQYLLANFAYYGISAISYASSAIYLIDIPWIGPLNIHFQICWHHVFHVFTMQTLNTEIISLVLKISKFNIRYNELTF